MKRVLIVALATLAVAAFSPTMATESDPLLSAQQPSEGSATDGAPEQSDARAVHSVSVADRVRARVPRELLGYFDLYLYVSKAERGPWAQKMFVLRKVAGKFKTLYVWSVSTGAEKAMTTPDGRVVGTHTPSGIFKLDPARSYRDYTSRSWRAPMPYAMFFDWQHRGRTSGLAIHGTDEEGRRKLGTRASHGCIRLATENAGTLFELVQSEFKGEVPLFAMDPKSRTVSTEGEMRSDRKFGLGYRVLLIIDDYAGPAQVASK